MNVGDLDFDGDVGALLLQLLIRVVLTAPAVTVPLLVGLLALFWWRERSSAAAATKRALERAATEQKRRLSAEAIQRWVDTVKQSDPSFQLLAFLDRVKETYLEVHRALSQGDVAPVRHLLSDAVAEELTTQLTLLRAQGRREATANLSVFDLTLVLLSRTPQYDTLHVRVTVRLRHAEIDAAVSEIDAARAAEQSPTVQRVSVWSFTRRVGAQTRPDETLAHRRCPSCGEAFTAGQRRPCARCAAILTGGQHDWVLSAISPGPEYRPMHRELTGLARAQQTEPSLSKEGLEDRARTLFWRWVSARAQASSQQLGPLVSASVASLLDAERAALHTAGTALQVLTAPAAAIDLMRVVPGELRDVALFECVWSGNLGAVRAGESVRGRPWVTFRQVLSLSRPAGVRPPIELGVSTYRCATCAAPLGDDRAPSCGSCGATLGEGGHDWVLDGLEDWEAYLAKLRGGQKPGPQRMQDRVPNPDERRRLLMLAARVAAADGRVLKRERSLLEKWAKRFDVPWADIAATLDAPPTGAPFPSPDAARAFLDELVELALVDGRVDPTEREVLEALALHAGVGDLLAARLKTERS